MWVAGGPTGTVTVCDVKSRTALHTYTVADRGFLNDVAVTRDALDVTDSQRRHLIVMPRGRTGVLAPESAVRTPPLTGDFQLAAGFNANGIVSTRNAAG